MAPLTTAERRELAALLRRLFDAVERGELDADTPQGRRLLTYLEGAAAALETTAGRGGGRTSAPSEP